MIRSLEEGVQYCETATAFLMISEKVFFFTRDVKYKFML